MYNFQVEILFQSDVAIELKVAKQIYSYSTFSLHITNLIIFACSLNCATILFRNDITLVRFQIFTQDFAVGGICE